jgi:hypothetical protein
MNDLFLLLFLVSFAGLIVGMIKPAIFSPFSKNKITRKTLGLIFSLAIIGFFILFGITQDKNDEKSTSQPVTEVEQDTILNIPDLLSKKFPEMKESLAMLCGDGVVAEAENTKQLNCIIDQRYNIYFELTDDWAITSEGIRVVGNTSYGDTEESILVATGIVKNSTDYEVSIKPVDSAGQIVLDIKR